MSVSRKQDRRQGKPKRGNQGTCLYLLSLLMLSGCPDYGHLRPEPDYDNMTDAGEEAPEEVTDD